LAYAAADGHVLHGTVTGASSGRSFIALRLGTNPGDSGGPCRRAGDGALIGLVSSNASPAMTENFSVKQGTDGEHSESQWERNGTPMGADTIAVHVPAVLAK
jgi:hypothetical protein